MTGQTPLRAADRGVRVRLRVTPKASRTAVAGIVPRADGTALKVAVTAAPEAGKANDAVIGLLAGQWRIPKSALTLLSGATDRNKTLHVAGPPERVMADISAWLGSLDS